MKLIDVCDFIVDCPHTTATDEGVGYPLIRTPNIGRGRLILDGAHRVSKDVYEKRNKRGVPTAGDLILAREAPAGNVAVIQAGQLVCLGQRTVLIRPNKDVVDSNYLAYYLLAPEQQYNLLGSANGATVAHVNMSIIRNLDINLPPIDIQCKIGKIISAYDDLIENNQKQIKLLEEAAQRLYKEWFIDLHFPGHEDCKIVDGVPEGWSREFLTDVADVQYGFAFDGSLFNSEKNGHKIIRIRNIPDSTTNDYTTQEADEQYIVHNGDIVVGMDGEFHINSWSGGDAYLVQRTCSFRPHDNMMKGYLLQAIHAPIKFFEKTLVGATVAHLGKKNIDTIKILIPPAKYYQQFENNYHLVQNLRTQNLSLKEARDRLLPKLMSGEIKL